MVNITPKKIELLKDVFRDILFHKVIKFCLPRFDDTEAGKQSLLEWLAAKLRKLYDFFDSASCLYA